MKHSANMSRRDWFRLRAPRQNSMLSESAEAVETEVLKPIEQPPNHDGLDLSQLPPMREAVLVNDQVDSLFRDIESLATDILLMQRSTGAARATASRAETSEQLALAKRALISGKVQRVQIRYRWQDSLWIDTLSVHAEGYRLVRITHQIS